MDSDKLTLALQKRGWTEADIERLIEGDLLAQILMVMRGEAIITAVEKEKKTPEISPRILNCAKPLDIPTFVGQDWKTWKGPATGDGLSGEEEIDPRSLALITLDPAKLLLENCLKEKEETITGEEKLKRLKEKPNLIRLGGNVFLALWEDYQQNKENSVFEWLYCTRKVTYMDFFGLILRDPRGYRRVLYLYRRVDGEWHWRCPWLDRGWRARSFSACAQDLPAEVPTQAG